MNPQEYGGIVGRFVGERGFVQKNFAGSRFRIPDESFVKPRFYSCRVSDFRILKVQFVKTRIL